MQLPFWILWRRNKVWNGMCGRFFRRYRDELCADDDDPLRCRRLRWCCCSSRRRRRPSINDHPVESESRKKAFRRSIFHSIAQSKRPRSIYTKSTICRHSGATCNDFCFPNQSMNPSIKRWKGQSINHTINRSNRRWNHKGIESESIFPPIKCDQMHTWKPACFISCARITWERPLALRKLSRAVEEKKWPVPRRLFGVKPWSAWRRRSISGVIRSVLEDINKEMNRIKYEEMK